MDFLLKIAFSPSDSDHIGAFYVLWMTLFVSAHVIWDMCSSKTGKFHLSRLRKMAPIVAFAGAFSSGFILLLSLLQPDVGDAVKDVKYPLAYAGFLGIGQGLSNLCPYDSDS